MNRFPDTAASVRAVWAVIAGVRENVTTQCKQFPVYG